MKKLIVSILLAACFTANAENIVVWPAALGNTVLSCEMWLGRCRGFSTIEEFAASHGYKTVIRQGIITAGNGVYIVVEVRK